MRFAPYTLDYPGLPAQVEQAALGATVGSDWWSKVKDFKWHRAQASPNWSVLPEPDRNHRPVRTDLVRNMAAAAQGQSEANTGGDDGESEDEL